MYKRLLTDSAIYGVGALLIKSLAFFTLPIYTRIFSPDEYGTIEMFVTIGNILSILMTMGLDSAQSFYFMEAKNKKTLRTEDITTSILGLRIVLGIAVIGIACALSPFLLDFAFKTDVPMIYLLIVAISIFFANLTSQSLEIFRLLYKPWHYIALSFLQTVANILLILYFTYVKGMGLYGYFLGMAISSFAAMFVGWIATRKYRYFKSIKIELWGNFLKFGAPLVPAGLSIWLMQAGDRWFVMKMLGSHDLGIYAVGAKISMILTLVVMTFRRAWWPIAMDMIHKPEGTEFIRKISFFYILLGSIAVIALAVMAPYLVKFLASEDYEQSYRLVGALGLGGVLYGFYQISELGIFKSQKTYLSIITNFTGAALNMILNYFLIQKFGIVGAAYATVASLMTANIIGMWLSNKYMHVKWNWLGLSICLLLSSAAVIYLGH